MPSRLTSYGPAAIVAPTTASPSAAPTLSLAPTPDQADVFLEIMTDHYPGETTWSAPGGLAAEDWVQTADGEWVRGGEGGA